MQQKIAAVLFSLAAGLCNGFFGSGGGTVIVPCMEKFLKTEPQKAHASAIAVILPLCAVSGFIYFKDMGIPWQSVIFAGIGGFTGGIVGAHLLGKIKSRTLHIVFGAVMIISGIRMLF